ncbi:hypothetical protein OGAPHI_000879 [Ogataea philodendri]|uniref:Uncharacterized protein n=1 Tax=Ogataea philodendri TaxID=1378263 RepID=A0A9P8PFN6_9ASCO|nr:uncharacterized protein OGAPHI_000879 [Ogataea philodendri]KAH3670364.1 hypothetical protein OGAPHI_000879 [Ogataea philodendri]
MASFDNNDKEASLNEITVATPTDSEKIPAISSVSWFRSTFFQATVVGFVALLAPGLYNAMQSTGAAGMFTPYLTMRANAILNTLMFLVCIGGSTVSNLIGLKYTFILGTTGYPLYAAAMYCNNRYGTEWFVYLGAAACGLSAGLFWASEGAIIIGYPEEHKRGRYLAYWLAFRNSGSIIGGAINLAFNAHGVTRGKLDWRTFLVFVILQSLSPFVAGFLSPPHKVRRQDGATIKEHQKTSTKKELVDLYHLFKSKEIILVLPLFFYATYELSYIGSYLTLYFTVRARALASLVSALVQILGNLLFGVFLDWKRFSVNQRAKIAYIFMMSIIGGCWIWGTVVQYDYWKDPPALDWNDSGFGRGWALYIFWQLNFSMVYNYCYWMIGYMTTDDTEHVRYTSIVRGVEAAGGAVAAGIASTKAPLIASTGINFGLWAISVPTAWVVIRQDDHLAHGEDLFSRGPEPERALHVPERLHREVVGDQRGADAVGGFGLGEDPVEVEDGSEDQGERGVGVVGVDAGQQAQGLVCFVAVDGLEEVRVDAVPEVQKRVDHQRVPVEDACGEDGLAHGGEEVDFGAVVLRAAEQEGDEVDEEVEFALDGEADGHEQVPRVAGSGVERLGDALQLCEQLGQLLVCRHQASVCTARRYLKINMGTAHRAISERLRERERAGERAHGGGDWRGQRHWAGGREAAGEQGRERVLCGPERGGVGQPGARAGDHAGAVPKGGRDVVGRAARRVRERVEAVWLDRHGGAGGGDHGDEGLSRGGGGGRRATAAVVRGAGHQPEGRAERGEACAVLLQEAWREGEPSEPSEPGEVDRACCVDVGVLWRAGAADVQGCEARGGGHSARAAGAPGGGWVCGELRCAVVHGDVHDGPAAGDLATRRGAGEHGDGGCGCGCAAAG